MQKKTPKIRPISRVKALELSSDDMQEVSGGGNSLSIGLPCDIWTNGEFGPGSGKWDQLDA